MKPYKLEAILGPLFKLFEATLELIVPLVIALIIDNGINGNGGAGDKAYIVKMALLLALSVIMLTSASFAFLVCGTCLFRYCSIFCG